MRFTTVFLLAAIAAVAVHASDVVDATDATFETVIASHDFVIVEFYAPWCGHCKKLEPEFDQAAAALKGEAVLAKVDATVDPKVAEKLEVKGYPTIKVFRAGQLTGDYEGGRTASDIIKYVKGNSGPALKTVTTAEDIATIKSENAVTVVVQLAEASGKIYEAVEASANALRSTAAFVLVQDSALFVGDNTITLSKTFDDKTDVVYTGDTASIADITAYVTAEAVPVFDEIGPENYKMYVERHLPMAWMFVTEEHGDAKAAAAEAAKGFKGKLSFVWIDAGKYGGMASRLGLPENQFPAFAIDNEGAHYPFDGTITAENLIAYTQKFVDGELATTVKTEAVPEQSVIKGVTTVVGATFEDIVEKAETDVFIKFYAPWCGHCKSMTPAFEELGATLENEPVVIANIDATANDYNKKMFDVQGFPTLFFVPKSTHQPIPYEGERNHAGMLAFIKEQQNA